MSNRRWIDKRRCVIFGTNVRNDGNKNIAGVEICDSYIRVKHVQWILDLLKQSLSETFGIKFQRCSIDFEMFESMMHHFQQTTESKHRIALHFLKCESVKIYQPSKYNIQNVCEISIEFDHVYHVYSMLKANISSLQNIYVDGPCVLASPPTNNLLNLGYVNIILTTSDQLHRIVIDLPTPFATSLVDEIIQNNPNLTTFIMNKCDELLVRDKTFVQAIQNIILVSTELNHVHNAAMSDILLAFILPLLPYIPRWFASKTYVNQLQLCHEMFVNI